MNAGMSKIGVLLCALLAAVLASLAGATVSRSATAAPAANPLAGVLKQVKGKSLSARESTLLNLAKREGGELNWYTSLSRTIGPGVVSAFEEKYPGIKVKMYRGSSEDVTARVTQEANAGTTGADVIETNGTEMTFYQHKKNILIPYRGSPYAKAIPKAYRFDTWTGDRIEAFVVAWNTNIIKPGQEPKSWADLATSRFAGKLSMEPGDVDWFAATYQHLEKQELAKVRPQPKTKAAKTRALRRIDARLNSMFNAIARNSQITSGHTTQATLLAAGQFGVCVSCHAQSIEALAARRAPITFKPLNVPTIIRAQGIGVVQRLKHPATALLFYDWMLHRAGGQAALLKGGANPARPDMPDPDLRTAKRVILDLRPIVANFKFWADKYDAVIRQAGK
ncbi:MAG TPA: extracellular solute-binding protein [Gaiellaceae bacterium]|jgi:iron(III) transport system substrate-binding protein|nr:extracellular solute-binding protein [Gaiellaceae bacterium]